MNFVSLARRAGALVALSGLALAGSAVLAGGASAVAGPVLTLESGTNGCEGVHSTPGSDNVSKTLVGGSMQPGELAVFNIDYPVGASGVGETFTITDCVFTGVGQDEEAIQKYTIQFVPNDVSYTLAYAIEVPEDLPLGTLYCNYAKTTNGPSASPASNRKSNPACFNVGGSLRIEKRADTEDGDVLPGASFSVVCTPTSLVPPVVIDGLDEANVATTGVIGINGPEGTPCVVTELAAPDGYDLPEVTSRTVNIPRGTSASVVPWVNTASASEECPEGTELDENEECVTPSESPSPDPSESPEPTVEPDDPTPTVSPSVLGVKQVRKPTTPAQLPLTGSPTGLLALAGLALTGLGAAMVLGSGRYARQH